MQVYIIYLTTDTSSRFIDDAFPFDKQMHSFPWFHARFGVFQQPFRRETDAIQSHIADFLQLTEVARPHGLRQDIGRDTGDVGVLT